LTRASATGAALALAAVFLAGPVAAAAPRILSLDQCADQYVLALAPRDEIVGLSKRALNADSALRAQAVGLPERRASMESILGARPTLVVRDWALDPGLPGALSRHGIGLVQIDDANDFAGVAANVRKVAAALDRRAAGEALIAGMNAKLAASYGAWGGAKTLYLTPEGFTAGQGTLVGAMLQAAGLTSEAKGAGYSPVPLESLVLQPPAALILGFFTDLAGGRQHWTIAGNGRVQALARDRTIASLPGSMLGCPTWFAADGAFALAQAHSAARR
jgi:iron complex transport system substrate-binding protein